MDKLVLSIEMSKTGANSALNSILSNLKWLGKKQKQKQKPTNKNKTTNLQCDSTNTGINVIPGTRQQVPRKTEKVQQNYSWPLLSMYGFFPYLPFF